VHPADPAGLPRIRLWESTSENWSGYAVPKEGTAPDTFSAVTGTWTVPSVTGSRRSASYAATWAGIDGYTSGTVEQIGTLQEWAGSRQENYAWFEMYPSGMYEIVGFPVDPGDSITATVTYEGDNVFQLTIENLTHPASFSVPTSYTTTSSTVARSSAEWVVEAPSSSRGILPLAEFKVPISFQGCSATSEGSEGDAERISYWTPDPLTMIDPSGGEAVPSGLSSGGTAFSVTWQ
jgi:hypothetical protein